MVDELCGDEVDEYGEEYGDETDPSKRVPEGDYDFM